MPRGDKSSTPTSRSGKPDISRKAAKNAACPARPRQAVPGPPSTSRTAAAGSGWRRRRAAAPRKGPPCVRHPPAGNRRPRRSRPARAGNPRRPARRLAAAGAREHERRASRALRECAVPLRAATRRCLLQRLLHARGDQRTTAQGDRLRLRACRMQIRRPALNSVRGRSGLRAGNAAGVLAAHRPHHASRRDRSRNATLIRAPGNPRVFATPCTKCSCEA